MLAEPQFLSQKRKLHEHTTLNNQNEAPKFHAPANLETNIVVVPLLSPFITTTAVVNIHHHLRHSQLKAYPSLCQSLPTHPKIKKKKDHSTKSQHQQRKKQDNSSCDLFENPTQYDKRADKKTNAHTYPSFCITILPLATIVKHCSSSIRLISIKRSWP